MAWFSDSATSSGNIIKSGTLDVEMKWAYGIDDPALDTTVWYETEGENAKPIFSNYDLWEPGYTSVRHIEVITSLQVGTVINEGDYLLLSESVYYYWNNGKKNNSLAGNTLYRVGIDEGSFYFAIDNGTTYVIDAEGKTKLKVVSGTGTSDNVFRFSVTD